MRRQLLFFFAFVLLMSSVYACPSWYASCLTWGNLDSMAAHQARNWTIVNRSNCTDHATFTFDSSDKQWYTLMINYLDNNMSKNSFQVFIDNASVGTVDDLDGASAFRSAMIYLGGKYTGKHIVELVSTEKMVCGDDMLVLNWVGVNTNYTSPPGGGSRGRRGGGEPAEAPPQEIPEFGTIGLLLGLIGGIVMVDMIRR